ncbi:hypothetical protein Pla22_52110 [Rubripirellula amarantea]|uniref:Uncharacterized protein n=1 Tax=Rubripirellula amarantea TaxID=2527999 RepID=A0A5C5WCY0_9BACT|nr:hypothetical protein Pla22_52110 [Rubripirellula amarantea]
MSSQPFANYTDGLAHETYFLLKMTTDGRRFPDSARWQRTFATLLSHDDGDEQDRCGTGRLYQPREHQPSRPSMNVDRPASHAHHGKVLARFHTSSESKMFVTTRAAAVESTISRRLDRKLRFTSWMYMAIQCIVRNKVRTDSMPGFVRRNVQPFQRCRKKVEIKGRETILDGNITRAIPEHIKVFVPNVDRRITLLGKRVLSGGTIQCRLKSIAVCVPQTALVGVRTCLLVHNREEVPSHPLHHLPKGLTKNAKVVWRVVAVAH